MPITLRSFDERHFAALKSWVPTAAELARWCGAFFTFPLDDAQLERYVASARQPLAREIFAAEQGGACVGHIEISMIWPHLSCRLSRVLVDPGMRRHGIGGEMVRLVAADAFSRHRVARINLGVSADNAAAIACYRRQGFAHVGTWPEAIETEVGAIHVYWMTLTREAFLR
jgi:RimJ/RimL family protein N-acetyltransferase